MLQKANSRNPKRKVPRRVPAGPLYSGYVALFLYSCCEFFCPQAETPLNVEIAKIPPLKKCGGRLRSPSYREPRCPRPTAHSLQGVKFFTIHIRGLFAPGLSLKTNSFVAFM